MELAIPRSLRPARQLLRICPRRSFTTTPVFLKGGQRVQQKRNLGPSPKVQQQQQMESVEALSTMKEMMSDIGVLHGTYIKPAGTALPVWFTNPRLRLSIEWVQLTSRVKGLMSLLLFKWQARKWPTKQKFPIKSWLPLYSKNPLLQTAQTLHTRYLKAMVENDKRTLKELMCKGLYDFTAPKLASRPSNDFVEHKAKEITPPRILSDRIGMLPAKNVEHCSIRQVVVRFNTEQSLERWSQVGKIWKNRIAPRPVIEYMVMQQRTWEGVKEDWVIQGFEASLMPDAFHTRNAQSEDRMIQMTKYNERTGMAP